MTPWLESPRRVAAIVAGLLSLVLLVLVLQPSKLPIARTFQAQDVPWSLPVPVTVEADKALSAISQRRLWAISPPGIPPALSGAAVDEAALTPPDWRIVGTVIDGPRQTVLVANEVPKGLPPIILTLRPGDRLPGGAKITNIRPDGVGLLLHGQRAFLSTYPQ